MIDKNTLIYCANKYLLCLIFDSVSPRVAVELETLVDDESGASQTTTEVLEKYINVVIINDIMTRRHLLIDKAQLTDKSRLQNIKVVRIFPNQTEHIAYIVTDANRIGGFG